MHLLEYNKDEGLLITSFDDNKLPPYAILSHRWGEEAEEVSFEDIAGNAGKDKSGYQKIRFCGEQAKRDNLQYFWIDTCCINKANKAEHSVAIRSMFRWYRNAARCYVYLLDVSALSSGDKRDARSLPWDSEFRHSEWFTRGWTLQELLAPVAVEFFSREGESLGNKTSLQAIIREITGIPSEVLNGAPVSKCSVNERLQWAEGRMTGRGEDRAYCLQGILDVELAPVYGEGEAGAFDRLKRELYKLEQCIQDIRQTDPRNDKKRIEDTKGGLLVDSYCWVLDNTAFQEWRNEQHGRLLWVKGDPGKGKTMLLCGIIDELQRSMPRTALLSYFFCQQTDARLNSATAVLRGLLYMLVQQQPSLVSHVRKRHDHAGRDLFEDANAWVALTEMWTDVVQDPSLNTTHLVIDALDECVSNLPNLLSFITKQSSTSSRVKWIVSSRNWPDIETQLERAERKVRLSLELNAESVAAAVNIFIRQKVDQLAQDKQYKEELRHAVLQHLTLNANDTFLWVALVCQDLRLTANRHVLNKLALFPAGLDALYERMMQQMSESDDAKICRCVLASTAILYRPVTVSELVALVKQLEDVGDDVREIINLCGSFLTLREDTVYFVHQSAKDFLFAKAYNKAFPVGSEAVHQAIFLRSLAILSKTLHRDMYSLEAPGYSIKNVKVPRKDPLVVSRYPCVYWIDHLYESNAFMSSVGGLQAADVVNDFLRKRYLYWLEGLSLCKSVGKGVLLIQKLWSLVQVCGARSTCLWFNLDTNASRRCVTNTDLLSLFKTHGDSSCTTKGQSRIILFRHMHLRSCSVRQVV
jgi:hypothetical protein